MSPIKEVNSIYEILISIGMKSGEVVCLRNYIDKLWLNILPIAHPLYQNDPPQNLLNRCRPLTRLAVLCIKLLDLQETYRLRGIPNQIFIDSSSDIVLRQELYYRKTGRLGISAKDIYWFRHLFNLEMFKLSALQFQPIKIFYSQKVARPEKSLNFSDAQKVKFPPGTDLINVHIQQEADLSPSAVDLSINQARSFFEKHFSEQKFKGFVCFSWLLYPGNRNLLASNSRILSFADRFEIIAISADNSQAIEKIYGKRFRAKKDYPQKTSLQINALKQLSSLGYACGVICFAD